MSASRKLTLLDEVIATIEKYGMIDETMLT
jgi:hypothetical protein